MFVSIDKRTMTVLHKHPSINVVLNLVYLEHPRGECSVSAVDHCIDDFSEMELKMMYRAYFTDQKIPDNYKYQLKKYICGIPVNDVIPEEVARLASTVGVNDRKTYKYVKGQFSSFMQPTIVDQPVQVPRYTPDPPPAYIPKPYNPNLDISDDDPLPPKDEPKQERAQREPSGPSQRPKAGSSTGKVWDIADEVSQTITDAKALRKAVIDRCVQEGINQSTASVQFGKWKNSQ